MGSLLTLIFAADKKPHHIETDCHCACDDSESSEEPQQTSTKSAAVARDSPT